MSAQVDSGVILNSKISIYFIQGEAQRLTPLYEVSASHRLYCEYCLCPLLFRGGSPDQPPTFVVANCFNIDIGLSGQFTD